MLDQKWSVGLPQSFEPWLFFMKIGPKNSKSRSTWLWNPLMVPFFGIHGILFKGHIAILATFLYGSSWFGLGKMTPKYHDSIPSPLRDRARKVSKIDPRAILFIENWRKCLVGEAILPIIMLWMSPKWVSRQKVPRYHQELTFNHTQP